ncbi:uncharacterized protein [Macrobrachium rosenbergii]|uniref:uncharacterized protein n=1 Tax=Macrobrachium rosenbergii TaxID=79674 RepID=UPI0034D5E7A0
MRHPLGCPSPIPFCCLATSTREATPKPPDWDTATVTGVPLSAQPSVHQGVHWKGHSPTNSRPSPQSSQKDAHQKSPPSPRREIRNHQYLVISLCKTSNVTGHSANWARCPSKQTTMDSTSRTTPRGSALHPRQESLSPTTSGTPRGFATPGPSSATPDSNLLPAPLESTEQCQALSISDRAPLLTLIPVPGPELVPVPDPNNDMDSPMGNPPNLTNLIITNCEPPCPDVCSSQSLPSAEDDSLADLNVTPSLVDQELSSQDDDAGSTLTTVVATAKVGSQPVVTRATPDPAPEGTSGLSPESVPSSPPRKGIAKPGGPQRRRRRRRGGGDAINQ